MNLDLKQIAIRRRQKDPDFRPMSYLLDQISGQMAKRVDELSTECRDWLIIDFQDNAFPSLSLEATHLSLLEGDSLQDLLREKQTDYNGVILNLQLAWLDYAEVFASVHQILRPGGKLMFSTLGPDTLFELNQAWLQVDSQRHIHPFVDLHHLGDRLVKCGFVKPILDTDWVGVKFDDVDLLMDDLRREGFHNISRDRRRTLMGKTRLKKLRSLFNKSPVNITFELIYGYAEKALAPNLHVEQNSVIVRVPQTNRK